MVYYHSKIWTRNKVELYPYKAKAARMTVCVRIPTLGQWRQEVQCNLQLVSLSLVWATWSVLSPSSPPPSLPSLLLSLFSPLPLPHLSLLPPWVLETIIDSLRKIRAAACEHHGQMRPALIRCHPSTLMAEVTLFAVWWISAAWSASWWGFFSVIWNVIQTLHTQ